jgi:Caudovirus prohead protease.
MTIQKAHWDTEGDNVRLSMPFSKVDQERRIVSGFATLDNIDKQSDIVTTDASLKAFAKFRGNIREMHQPTAVGKMVSFKEDKYFDPESKKFYTGVYVSAYVSKGAQDTWEKVLDGTLSGFSIGGRMNKWDDAYDEKADAPVRIIKEYDLVELSLVDNPANQFANVLSIEKVDGVDVVTGIDANTELENVFWDADSGLVLVSEE